MPAITHVFTVRDTENAEKMSDGPTRAQATATDRDNGTLAIDRHDCNNSARVLPHLPGQNPPHSGQPHAFFRDQSRLKRFD